MSYSSRAMWIICTAVIVALGSCGRDDGEGRRSFKSLAQAYEDAHTRQDIDALMELVHIGSGPSAEVNLRAFRASFEYDLEHDIKRIFRKRLEREDRERDKYATLKPLGLMNVEWVTNDENFQSHSFYRFGKDGGNYYIAGTGPGLVQAELRSLAEGANVAGEFPDVMQRAAPALSKWLNPTSDPEPIMFWAVLARPSKRPETLWLYFIDEDMDAVGFAIEEHYVDAKGARQTRLEEYPAFAHTQWIDVLGSRMIPVCLRDADQRADKERWNSYVEGTSIDPNMLTSRDYWKERLPPVWVSIPEPNVVDVNVYVYDRAGNRSESVKLLNPTQKD
ncbi:MAG: hypothetical protein ACYSWW_21005 [Planctomycetota bacterium]